MSHTSLEKRGIIALTKRLYIKSPTEYNQINMTSLTEKDWELFTQTIAHDTEQYDSARAIDEQREAEQTKAIETEFYEP